MLSQTWGYAGWAAVDPEWIGVALEGATDPKAERNW
jgi:hypothetical protein